MLFLPNWYIHSSSPISFTRSLPFSCSLFSLFNLPHTGREIWSASDFHLLPFINIQSHYLANGRIQYSVLGQEEIPLALEVSLKSKDHDRWF